MGSSALAAPASSTLSFLKGSVEVRATADGPAAAAKLGEKLAPGSVILTHEKSLAIVTLPDHSQLKVNPNSELMLDEVKSSRPKAGSTLLTLRAGGVFTKVAKQAAGAKFQLRTKSAVMGVRGTAFYTSFDAKNPAHPDLWMCVNEGVVQVESAEGSKKSVSVKEGEGVVIPSGKEVTDPKPYSWTKKLNWNMNPDAGEIYSDAPIKTGNGDETYP
ncbi:MAG: FecR family protein [Bdellovibrionota bacterium]